MLKLRPFITVVCYLSLSLSNIIWAQQNSPQSNKPDAGSTSQKAEHFVAPFTRWAEDSIQNSELLQPSKPKAHTPKGPGISLRQAINMARSQHQGTVLSAKYQAAENHYLIKIISSKGVVKTLVIRATKASR